MSLSKRARRAAQHDKRRAEVELNLIPLIDIMSVMVSFLLVYSADVEAIQTSKGVEIPQSIAEQKPHESVVVMITTDHLFVQGEPVASIEEIRAAKTPLIDSLSAVRCCGATTSRTTSRVARSRSSPTNPSPTTWCGR